MNHLLYFNDDKISQDQILISGSRTEHLKTILNIKIGDKIKVGEYLGKVGGGVIEKIGTEVQIKVKVESDPPGKIPLRVIIGLSRPKVMARLIADLTTSGVQHIDIIQTWHGDKGYWNNDIFSESGLKKAIVKGLEQSMDTIPPNIKLIKRFGPYSNDVLPTYLNNSKGYIAQPGSEHSLKVNSKESSVIAIGPERGFTPYEVNQFIKAGFEPVALGKRILRTEVAVHFAVSRFS